MACCSERSRELGDLAAGRLDADAAEGLLDHVETCPECSSEFDLVSDLVTAAETDGPGIFENWTTRWWARPAFWVPAAAAACFVVWFGLDLMRTTGESVAQSTEEGRLRSLASLEPIPAFDGTLRSSDPRVSRDFRDALELYRSGDFVKAAAILAGISEGVPESPMVSLYLGICWLKTGSPRATDAFTRVALTGRGLVRERGLWYLAQAHLRSGDGKSALAVLRELVEIDSDYEVNARQLIDDIEQAMKR